MLQHWNCLVYRDPDLRLLFGHQCEVRIYQWTRARGTYPAGRVLLFPFSVLCHCYFKHKRRTLFGLTQPRIALRIRTPPDTCRTPHGLRLDKASHAPTWCHLPECQGIRESRSRHPAWVSSNHGKPAERTSSVNLIARGAFPSPPIRCVPMPGAA